MATTAELLAEARDARHKLLTGTAETEIRTADGESVKYAAADVTRLDTYIAGLEAQLGKRRRGIKVFF